MKKTDKITLREKSPAELSKKLTELKVELAHARAKHFTGSSKDTSVFHKIKYQIALIKTLLTKHD